MPNTESKSLHTRITLEVQSLLYNQRSGIIYESHLWNCAVTVTYAYIFLNNIFHSFPALLLKSVSPKKKKEERKMKGFFNDVDTLQN